MIIKKNSQKFREVKRKVEPVEEITSQEDFATPSAEQQYQYEPQVEEDDEEDENEKTDDSIDEIVDVVSDYQSEEVDDVEKVVSPFLLWLKTSRI